MFDNAEDQRFDFTLVINPSSRGDFGAIRIGGLHRSIGECVYDAEQMKQEILRHVDGIESISYTVEDIYSEYEDIAEWTASNLRTEKWNDVKKQLKPKDNVDYKEVLKSLILDIQSATDLDDSAREVAQEYHEEYFEE